MSYTTHGEVGVMEKRLEGGIPQKHWAMSELHSIYTCVLKRFNSTKRSIVTFLYLPFRGLF
jgi:hypothetical protein